MQAKERKIWQLAKVTISAANAVAKVSFKLDDSVRHCRNIVFSFNISGKPQMNYLMGDIALFVNNRKGNPLQYTLHSLPTEMHAKKVMQRLKLDTCIEGGSFVQGHFRDLGLSLAYPYDLRIYLECTANG